ncbi:hypothetical protein FJO69_02610 [[Mycoplasma] falconis]|uniref:Uncharacterized protein n=1 Tax=[Mycoplasma] falconis TaxID=92403 RepID=A0A501X8X7_9BACT|nr:hypothetical protein [[Mycoplasma] falconis]TPE56980.1 hypothetical protein FJO69_02610 [[Mycoplasma] falconis]
MPIRPTFSGSPMDNDNGNTKTLTSINLGPTVKTTELEVVKNKVNDPKGIIPNGIYRVFNHEIKLRKFMISLDLIVFFASLIISLLFGLIPSLFNKQEGYITPWGWYIIPVLLMAITLTNSIFEGIELGGIKNAIVSYRELITRGQLTAPPFISILYLKLNLKQVRRTWFIIAFIFYIGLFTLIFWALKDKKFSETVDFGKWIHNSFPNPDIVVYILCGIIGMVLVLYIVNSIYRKKRIIDIQTFFGHDVMNVNEVQTKKTNAHKFWAKIFFISILVLLVLPFIIYILVKKFGMKGK